MKRKVMMNKADWATLSNDLVYSSMGVIFIAFISFAFQTAWSFRVVPQEVDAANPKSVKYTKAGRIGIALAILGFLFLSAGVVARGVSAGRVPWGNMYEFSITGALAFLFAYLVTLRKYKIQWLGLIVTVAVLLTLGTAVTLLYVPSAPLVPALKSAWLVIHVCAAIISGGVFLLANCVAGAYLIMDRYQDEDGNENRPNWAKQLPTLAELDQLSYRLVALVFPLWTFAVIAGAIWAEAAWGRYWGWDPKETWAFITWVAYAAYLHARVTAGWKGKRAAWLC
jgi:cytochrome c-type biogenesis protein CcsB